MELLSLPHPSGFLNRHGFWATLPLMVVWSEAAFLSHMFGVAIFDVLSLLQVVSLETANDGITCNAICPGYVMTPMLEPWIQKMTSQEGVSFEEATKRVLAVQPLQRFTRTDEIGDLVLFLCSQSAQSITGTALEISGGWSARI